MADCSQMRVSSCIYYFAWIGLNQLCCPTGRFNAPHTCFLYEDLISGIQNFSGYRVFKKILQAFWRKKNILYFVQDLTKLDANIYIWFAPVLMNYFKTSAVPMEHKNLKWDYQSQATRWGKSKISKTSNFFPRGCHNIWTCHITHKICQT